MKNIRTYFQLVFLTLTIALVSSANAFAAESKHANAWIDVWGIVDGSINAGLDLKLTKHISVAPAVYIFKTDSVILNESATGYGAYLRYYFDEALASGFRLSGFGYSIPLKYSVGVFSGSSNITAYGALLGYHWIGGVLSSAIDLGEIYYSTSGNVTVTNAAGTTRTVAAPSYKGWNFYLQISAGLAF